MIVVPFVLLSENLNNLNNDEGDKAKELEDLWSEVISPFLFGEYVRHLLTSSRIPISFSISSCEPEGCRLLKASTPSSPRPLWWRQRAAKKTCRVFVFVCVWLSVCEHPVNSAARALKLHFRSKTQVTWQIHTHTYTHTHAHTLHVLHRSIFNQCVTHFALRFVRPVFCGLRHTTHEQKMCLLLMEKMRIIHGDDQHLSLNVSSS